LHLGELMKAICTETKLKPSELLTDITGITCDSRQVKPGFLFAAMPGNRVDGNAYIKEAVYRGAVAVLATKMAPANDVDDHTRLIECENIRHCYALMAARFYGRQPEHVVAITGTNGKTSVAGFIRQIWAELGLAAASSGTLGLDVSGVEHARELMEKYPSGLTTPDSAGLHRMLTEIKTGGVDHLALEASSHGLHQCRLDGVRIGTGVFTNLSRDHLDYHGSVDAYLSAKLKLFEERVVIGGTAVIDADDPFAEDFTAAARNRQLRVIRYGLDGDDVELLGQKNKAGYQDLELKIFGEIFSCRLPLIGDFQVSNAMAALSAVIAGGADVAKSVKALEKLTVIQGRMECVGNHPLGGKIYIDYAHTPAALETALATLRDNTKGDVHVVFGCGGDRDQGKRHEMGEIAGRVADYVYVTDDNPRGEDGKKIRDEILKGCPDGFNIPDRGDAIRQAIKNLHRNDALLIAGKGHETGQIVGHDVLPFSDHQQVRAALDGGLS